MGKRFFSSAHNKPSFFLSLVASLALHAGGMYCLLQRPFSFLLTAKESPSVEHLPEKSLGVDNAIYQAFQSLVIREDQDEHSFSPSPTSTASLDPLTQNALLEQEKRFGLQQTLKLITEEISFPKTQTFASKTALKPQPPRSFSNHYAVENPEAAPHPLPETATTSRSHEPFLASSLDLDENRVETPIFPFSFQEKEFFCMIDAPRANQQPIHTPIPSKKIQNFIASNLEIHHPSFSNQLMQPTLHQRPFPQFEPFFTHFSQSTLQEKMQSNAHNLSRSGQEHEQKKDIDLRPTHPFSTLSLETSQEDVSHSLSLATSETPPLKMKMYPSKLQLKSQLRPPFSSHCFLEDQIICKPLTEPVTSSLPLSLPSNPLDLKIDPSIVFTFQENSPLQEYGLKQVDTDPLEAMKPLQLPCLSSRQATPKKTFTAREKRGEGLLAKSTPNDLLKTCARFPNTKKLLEKKYFPSKIASSIAITSTSIEKPKTDEIHSQAQEILEDYHQENSASSGRIPLITSEIQRGIDECDIRSLNQSNRFTQAFLANIPPPSDLGTITYQKEFDTKVYYAQREDQKGYFFAIKMQAKPSLYFSSPYQHFIFIIDGSSSIKKHRFTVFKEGVSRSLKYLKQGDSFNILVADAELTPFSKHSTPWNQKSKEEAIRFLHDQTYRGFFINYDAFDLLSQTAKYFDPEKENVVVMITDGHAFQNLKAHKEEFQKLMAASQKRFSLYTATASTNNNLTMLDLVSTFNHGKLMYSKTNTAFSRQLAVMVKHIESLIAKDMRVYVTDANQKAKIEFYPNQHTLPPLYSDCAYTIYGTIDELKDFDLILQGRYNEQWMNIKQHISFKCAEEASNKLKRSFALQRAYVCYDYYLKKDDPFFLAEAERILTPYLIPAASR